MDALFIYRHPRATRSHDNRKEEDNATGKDYSAGAPGLQPIWRMLPFDHGTTSPERLPRFIIVFVNVEETENRVAKTLLMIHFG